MPSSFQEAVQKLGFRHEAVCLSYCGEATPVTLKIPLEFLSEHTRSIGYESGLGM